MPDAISNIMVRHASVDAGRAMLEGMISAHCQAALIGVTCPVGSTASATRAAIDVVYCICSGTNSVREALKAKNLGKVSGSIHS